MCGIAGAMSRQADVMSVEAARLLTDALAHRGPDGSGFWSDADPSRVTRASELPPAARTVLGHRRLSIVDIEGGSQPLANEDGSVWVSYNGEIFNAPELRRELERGGHVFRTRADTEVLVHGWEEWGERLFGRLNGMFAFALAERDTGNVWLVRDPVGVKPLYVGTRGETTWWASELGAARRTGMTRERVDREALKLYLTFRFVPSPYSIFDDAWKVPPASFVRLRATDAGQRPVFVRYESVVRSTSSPIAARDWAAAIIDGLDAAVQRQLMSDVPVGSLLSGGIDSSLVTMMMQRSMPSPPVSFGIGFSSHGESSELHAGRLAASALGVPFVATEVEDNAYLGAWPESHRTAGEPVGNSSSLLLGMLCRTVGRTHKVVLTGQGADEPLGGYPRHMAERLFGVGRHMPAAGALAAQRLLGSDAGDRLLRVLKERDRVARFAEILTVLPSAEVDAMVPGGVPAKELARRAVAQWMPDDSPRDSLNALLIVDARMSLADDLLLVADHFSMASSVELRVPFLDLELLDLLERMPSRYKVSWSGRRKWLYRRAALSALPPVLSASLGGFRNEHGRKVGFRTPVDRWFTPGSPLDAGWSDGLSRIEALDASLVRRTCLANGDSRRVRQQLAFYALAKWHG
jgi:asparagine synthase (glutamine-hydrolysing)